MDHEQRQHIVIQHAFLHSMTNTGDPSMVISDQELQWALELKHLVNESERLNLECPMSDMELAHHAIIAQGNVVEALVRIEGLDRFRREYRIDQSVQQGLYFVLNFMKQQPGYLLHLDANPQTYEGIMVTDSAAFSDKCAREATPTVSAEEQWRICVGAIYYLHYAALSPTLASVRQGISATVECDGVGWHNIGSEYISRLFEEMFSYLPVRFTHIRAYNTTVVANLLFSLARPFMSPNMRRSVQLGHQIIIADSSDSTTNDHVMGGPRRLSEFYHQPSLEMAQHRVIQRVQTLLTMRFYHDKEFRLC
jgi:hypothetical protein